MPRVVHFEIHAADPERACEFYGELLGWESTRWEGPVPYWLVKTGEAGEPGIDGGIVVRRGPGPDDGQPVNAYICTIGVPELDQVLERLERLGGVLAVPKMPIPGVGWVAYGKDPEGNIFGLMQSDPEAS